MAQNRLHLTVFATSPSDVADDRAIVSDIVAELNKSSLATLSTMVSVKSWDSDTHPDVASDPQAVINSQIGEDYDILVSIFWSRLGTETPRAISGTVEELDRALKKYAANPVAVKVLVYFKEAAVPYKLADGEQLTRLKGFRKQLGEKGVLFHTYDTTDQLEEKLRLHLAKVVGELKSVHGASEKQNIVSNPTSNPNESSDSEDDLGILDLNEVGISSMNDAAGCAERFVRDMGMFGERMNTQTENALTAKDSPMSIRPVVLRQILQTSSEDMEHLAKRMDAETESLAACLKRGIKAFTKMVLLSAGVWIDPQEMAETRIHVGTARTNWMSVLRPAQEFMSVISNLPKFTKSLNKAKRSVCAAVERFISEVKAADSLLQELEDALNAGVNIDDAGDQSK